MGVLGLATVILASPVCALGKKKVSRDPPATCVGHACLDYPMGAPCVPTSSVHGATIFAAACRRSCPPVLGVSTIMTTTWLCPRMQKNMTSPMYGALHSQDSPFLSENCWTSHPHGAANFGMNPRESWTPFPFCRTRDEHLLFQPMHSFDHRFVLATGLLQEWAGVSDDAVSMPVLLWPCRRF